MRACFQSGIATDVLHTGALPGDLRSLIPTEIFLPGGDRQAVDKNDAMAILDCARFASSYIAEFLPAQIVAHVFKQPQAHLLNELLLILRRRARYCKQVAFWSRAIFRLLLCQRGHVSGTGRLS